MRRILIKNIKSLVSLVGILAILIVTACNKPREGCLDVNGTNYDVLAEIDCCCSYPNLSIVFNPKYDDENISFNNFGYINNSGQNYGLASGKLLINNFLLVNQEGRIFEIQDSVELKTDEGNDSLYFKNDFINIASLSPRSYTLSQIPVDEYYSTIQFSMGFAGGYCEIDPLNLPSNTELARSLNSLYSEALDNFFSARIDLVVDSTENGLDIKTIFIPLCQEDASDIFTINKTGTPGFNFTINIELNIREWFGDINLAELDSLNILPELSSRFFSSITVE